MSKRLIITSLILAACDSYVRVPTDKEEAGSAQDVCNITARLESPSSSGATDFYFLDDVVFVLDGAWDEASISLEESDGTEVAGTTRIGTMRGEPSLRRLRFVPDAPLSPRTEYFATLRICDEPAEVSFWTSELGTPLSDPSSLVGRTFAIDLSMSKVIEPGPVVQVMFSLVDNDLFLEVEDVATSDLNVSIAPTNRMTGSQDTCLPSASFEGRDNFVDLSTFSVGPVDMEFSLAGYPMTLLNARSQSTFSPDGSYFDGGLISGTIDARDVIEVLASEGVVGSSDPTALCDLVGRIDVACTPCPDGELLCLDIVAENISGRLVSDTITSVESIDCHPACMNSCSNDICPEAEDYSICLED